MRGPIQWQITNPAPEGWEFQTVGIDIQNPGGEFGQPHGGGSRAFTWNNKHTRSATFKYRVKGTNGAANAEVEPTMIND